MPLVNQPYGKNFTSQSGFSATESMINWSYTGGVNTLFFEPEQSIICHRTGTVVATLTCRNPSGETYTFRARRSSPPVTSPGTVVASQTLSTSPVSIFTLTFSVTKLDVVGFTMQAQFNTTTRYFQLNWQYQ